MFLVDGSSTICPDEAALQEAFGQPIGCKAGCGFPVPKLLGLFNAWTGMIQELLVQPLYTHDLSGAWQLHRCLGPGDVLVGDRGFCSFAHLALLQQAGVHGLFRLHQRVIVSFRPYRRHGGRGRPTSAYVRRLGRQDQLVDWRKPKVLPRWMSSEQYATLQPTLRVRELRYRLIRRGQRTRCITIVTALLDPVRDPADRIAELYGVRWQVETFFRFFKHVLGCRHLLSHCQNGIEIQTYVAIIACLLIALWTGRKPTLRTYEMLCFYMTGLASEEELLAHIEKLRPQS